MAEVNGRIVVGLGSNGSEPVRIRHIGEFGVTVSKDSWGVGIGTELIGALIDWAKNTGLIRKINLRVHQDNVRAISREYYYDGEFYDNEFMGLAICFNLIFIRVFQIRATF